MFHTFVSSAFTAAGFSGKLDAADDEAQFGGLLEHTLSLCELADAISKFYPLLNRDLLVVSAFIHDLGKTWELTYAAGFGYSDGGHLVGHIAKGIGR